MLKCNQVETFLYSLAKLKEITIIKRDLYGLQFLVEIFAYYVFAMDHPN